MQYVDISKLRLGKPFPALHLCCPNGGHEVTVEGNAPLSFEAKRRELLSALVRYGLCEQNGTPTPSSPVDIVCNNGALKMVDDELPTGYKRLLGITFDGEVYYTTNYHMRGADTLRFSFKATIDSRNVLGCYNGTSATDNFSFYFLAGSGGTYLRYNGGLYRPVAPYLDRVYNCVISPTGVTGLSTSVSWTEADFTSATALFIGWLDNATSPKFIGDMYGSITVDSRANFIPVERQSDGAIGYWDGQTFLDNQGTGTPVSLGYDTSHYRLSVGGTHPGQNLVDLTAVTDDYYYDSSGVYTALSNARLTDYIYVKAGQKYTVYVKAQRAGVAANIRCNLFDSAKVWKSQSTFAVNSGSEGVGVITPTEDGYLRVSANYAGTGAQADWSVLQIVQGEYTLSTMPPYQPYTEIPYLPEVLTVSGANLLDPSTSNITIGEYVSADGSTCAGANNWRTDFIPVEGGKTYAFWGRKKEGNTISAYNRINWYTANKVHISPRATILQDIVTVGTAPSNAAYAMLSCAPINSSTPITRDTFDEYNWMFAEASEEIPYQPYVTPQTANVEALLGVGDYKDMQEVLSGLIDRKVGVKVFDGTETWVQGGTQNQFYSEDAITDRLVAGRDGFCTHFVFSTNVSDLATAGYILFGSSTQRINISSVGFADVTAWKAWLAAQYAAGDPVIVIYPLATPTTEQVQGQALYANKGANTVDSEANVSPVEMSITYID